MSNIAIVASGLTSPLFCMLELADQLHRDGHQIRFFAPEISQEAIAIAGFDITLMPEPHVWAYGPLLPPLGQDGGSTSRRERIQDAVAAFGVQRFGADLKAHEPELIIVDCELHAHILVALSLGIPVVQTHNMYLTPPALNVPPLHKWAVPGKWFWGSRFGTGLLWLDHLIHKVWRILKNKVGFKGADFPSALGHLARILKLDLPAWRRFKSWQYPWTYRIPTFLSLPRALDFPNEPRNDVHYLGPMICGARPAVQIKPSETERFCHAGPEKKRIYAAYGSMLTPDAKFITKLWEAVARHPEWQLLCVVGKNWTAPENISPPANVEVVQWVAQPEMLELADLAIFHGGAGTLIEAADTGTAMLIYPSVLDQLGNAARVAFHGLGRVGKERDSSLKMEADISAILESAKISSACKKMQAALQAERNAQPAQKLVRRLLS